MTMKYKNLSNDILSTLNKLHIGETEFKSYHNNYEDIQLTLLDAGRITSTFKQFIESRYKAMQFINTAIYEPEKEATYQTD
ncbi:hypothetical protein UFOVP1655_125 [uncultured Caudovirales phage]|uniref:Uncharacterized protein n=1 Tax=uncultured Caudovirales phage TaxID=2100421 RepID=A0A6J5T439_9CAUD|nr:hypothetical protein UFOVP1655_125 [uncultured Caudovirales phage]